MQPALGTAPHAGRAQAKKTSKKKPIEQYGRGDKQRANNPLVGLVTPETDSDGGKRRYAYDEVVESLGRGVA